MVESVIFNQTISFFFLPTQNRDNKERSSNEKVKLL